MRDILPFVPMSGPRRTGELLLQDVRAGEFTPAVRDVNGLIDILETASDDLVKAVQKSILRVGLPAASVISLRLQESKRPVRGLLVKILGRIGKQTQNTDVFETILSYLYDPDLKTRRNAIIALGHMHMPGIEDVLLQKWDREDRVDHRRSIADALGRVGGKKSLDAICVYKSGDSELNRIMGQAGIIIKSKLSRLEKSNIDSSVKPDKPADVILHCREGYENLLVSEFNKSWNPKIIQPGKVRVTLQGKLDSIFQSRIFMWFGFVLPVIHDTGYRAVVKALTGKDALQIFNTWTCGVIRYRLEWTGTGPRRADVWKCATAISAARPELINDPENSTWEAVIFSSKSDTIVELVPKMLPDPRFTYRKRFVYAASHPALAAALVHIAEILPTDIVWDPFVGSGTELVERAKAGKYQKLHGTDINPDAIEAAKENMAAAGISGTDLRVANAVTEKIPGVTLIITNPPMGRRLRGGIKSLLKDFIDNVGKNLVHGGRFVWVTAFAERNIIEAKQAGLKLKFKQTVDMGGFRVQLQSYTKI